jgi:hypothetical protein
VRTRIVKAFSQDDFFIIVAVVRILSHVVSTDSAEGTLLTSPSQLFAMAMTIAMCVEAKIGSPFGLLGMTSAALKVCYLSSCEEYMLTLPSP